jgi:large subunit ribosomal protein L13e
MVKHNNIIPNIHCKKKYCSSSRGPLSVRLGLNQATQKKERRNKRAAKAALIAPAPLQRLYPVVHCPTQKYSSKIRLGKGFTLEELKAVKLHPKKALTIGIAIDHRRRNHCDESFNTNVARLQEYLGNVIVIDKKNKDLASTLVQYKGSTIQPLIKPAHTVEIAEITQEMKDFKAYTTMRVVSKETRVDGYRISVKNRKDKD